MSNKLIYLIAGDGFMRRAEYEALLPQVQKLLPGECEIQSFDVTDTPLSQILANARSLPFLAEGQILRVKQADKLKEDALDELEGYLKAPFAKTALIFEADKAEDRGRLVKLIQQFGTLIRPAAADRMKREAQFLKAKLTEARKTITPGAQKMIFDMCGESPVFLASMIDRLVLFAGDKPQIDEAMTQQFDEDWAEVRIFDLSNAILAKNPAEALRVLNKLFEMDDDIYSMLGFIHAQVKKLWQAKFLMEEGLAPSQVIARLGMKPGYGADNFFRALAKFELSRLETAIQDLHDLDIKSKTGRALGKPSLEMWLLKITAPAALPSLSKGRSRS
ncbi:MAG TPA: DNA polymerase III subunit delta [Candidatus Omnitrophica bacterium]|nr:DNA polymerase III subunit delta [Candidatus Omnitrophota bacterium]